MFRLIKRIHKTLKKYPVVYAAVDIHETTLKPTWSKDILAYEYYPFAKKVLQLLSNSDKFKLILWTSSHSIDIGRYIYAFKDNGINFDYVNTNPECANNDFACFDYKMYFDVGFDDRFGFNPYIDWFILYIYFKYILWLDKK